MIMSRTVHNLSIVCEIVYADIVYALSCTYRLYMLLFYLQYCSGILLQIINAVWVLEKVRQYLNSVDFINVGLVAINLFIKGC